MERQYMFDDCMSARLCRDGGMIVYFILIYLIIKIVQWVYIQLDIKFEIKLTNISTPQLIFE